MGAWQFYSGPCMGGFFNTYTLPDNIMEIIGILLGIYTKQYAIKMFLPLTSEIA
jgi:hypothetical protein